MKAMFTDGSTEIGIHIGHVEHTELDLTAEELERIKARAAKAVTMDTAGRTSTPDEYLRFLKPDPPTSYGDFLRGQSR